MTLFDWLSEAVGFDVRIPLAALGLVAVLGLLAAARRRGR